jgi:hypothetical protein
VRHEQIVGVEERDEFPRLGHPWLRALDGPA